MSQITAQIEGAQLKQIDALATARKVSREEVASNLLAAALSDLGAKAAKAAPKAAAKEGDSK